MGQLIVRNIDDAIVDALKARAVAQGRSAEAEHRDILRRELAADESPQNHVADWFERARELGARLNVKPGPSSTELLQADRDRNVSGTEPNEAA